MFCHKCGERVVVPYKYHVCNFFRTKRNLRFMFIFTILVLSIAGLVAFRTISSRVDHPKILKKCHDKPIDLEVAKYESYFKKAKAGIHAKEVAQAVKYSKRKRLTAAICMVESQGKKTAYNKSSKTKGLFQVKEKYWNKVNVHSALAMTAQHDVIMDELMKCSGDNLNKALNMYGGDSKGDYAKVVLTELSNVP